VINYLSIVCCVKCPPSQLHYSFARVVSECFIQSYNQWCERVLLRHTARRWNRC